MKKTVLISLFILLNFQLFSQITQGDVLINSFNPRIGTSYFTEMVVLVNYTSSTIDLTGYELVCFKFDGYEQTPYWQFTGTDTYTLPPYGFLLITNNTSSVSGVSADLIRTNIPGSGRIDDDGYLTLREINANNPAEYIDIVKYSKVDYPSPNPIVVFSGVPANSGIDSTMPAAVFDSSGGPSTYLTRGGVSGNLGSLTYTGYGMIGQTVSDFVEVNENDNTYIQNSTSAPLPVELSSFSAVLLYEKKVMLKWRTETEVSNYGFEIQRKTLNDNEWTKIGFVAGNGNSNSPKNYSFTDGNPVNGGKFNYRLKQIDIDGEYEFSNEIEIEIVPRDFVLYQNYPNPFNPSTKIRFQLPKESKVVIKIYDIIGSEIMTLLNENKEPGIYEVELNGNILATGTYIYRIVAGDFVETKKMVLMK